MHVRLLGHDPSMDPTYGGCRTDERSERALADKLQVHLEKSTLQPVPEAGLLQDT